MTLAVPLKPHNQAALDDFLTQLYDPASPGYHHYLTPQQFTQRFFDTADRAQVADYVRAQGFTVHDPGIGAVINATGSVAQAERAFNVTIADYRDTSGHVYFANDMTPALPQSIVAHINGVLGLDSAEAGSHGGTRVGFANPALYALLNNKTLWAAAFHDVTVGDNCFDPLSTCGTPNNSSGKYPATPQYDLMSGIGSPNFGSLAQVLLPPNALPSSRRTISPSGMAEAESGAEADSRASRRTPPAAATTTAVTARHCCRAGRKGKGRKECAVRVGSAPGAPRGLRSASASGRCGQSSASRCRQH